MRLKYVVRRLLHSPLFTAVSILTLALGIGANSAIFSVIEGVMLKPLDYPEPGRLVAIDHEAPGVNISNAGIAPFLYFTYREDAQSFQDVAAWDSGTATVTGLAEPEDVSIMDVTQGALPILGVAPIRGRWFSQTDDLPDSPRTVILSYGYWHKHFGGDFSAIGKSLTLGGGPAEIIGIMPEKFRFMDQSPALYLPMKFNREKTFLGNFSFAAVARLKPGISMQKAQADCARLIPISMHKFPPFPGYTASMFESARLTPHLRPLKDDLIGDIGK